MERLGYRLDDREKSEIQRALSVAPSFSGAHPSVEKLSRRDRKTSESRRLEEFLRIDRGRET